MAIVKNWTIKNLETRPSLFGKNNVVSAVQWELSVINDGSDDTTPGATSINGYQTLNLPDETFVNFESLTKQIVLGWLFDAMGAEKKTEYELQGEYYIMNIVQPVTENPPLPWE